MIFQLCFTVHFNSSASNSDTLIKKVIKMFKSCVVCNVFFKYCKILTEDKKICEKLVVLC